MTKAKMSSFNALSLPIPAGIHVAVTKGFVFTFSLICDARSSIILNSIGRLRIFKRSEKDSSAISIVDVKTEFLHRVQPIYDKDCIVALQSHVHKVTGDRTVVISIWKPTLSSPNEWSCVGNRVQTPLEDYQFSDIYFSSQSKTLYVLSGSILWRCSFSIEETSNKTNKVLPANWHMLASIATEPSLSKKLRFVGEVDQSIILCDIQANLENSHNDAANLFTEDPSPSSDGAMTPQTSTESMLSSIVNISQHNTLTRLNHVSIKLENDHTLTAPRDVMRKSVSDECLSPVPRQSIKYLSLPPQGRSNGYVTIESEVSNASSNRRCKGEPAPTPVTMSTFKFAKTSTARCGEERRRPNLPDDKHDELAFYVATIKDGSNVKVSTPLCCENVTPSSNVKLQVIKSGKQIVLASLDEKMKVFVISDGVMVPVQLDFNAETVYDVVSNRKRDSFMVVLISPEGSLSFQEFILEMENNSGRSYKAKLKRLSNIDNRVSLLFYGFTDDATALCVDDSLSADYLRQLRKCYHMFRRKFALVAKQVNIDEVFAGHMPRKQWIALSQHFEFTRRHLRTIVCRLRLSYMTLSTKFSMWTSDAVTPSALLVETFRVIEPLYAHCLFAVTSTSHTAAELEPAKLERFFTSIATLVSQFASRISDATDQRSNSLAAFGLNVVQHRARIEVNKNTAFNCSQLPYMNELIVAGDAGFRVFFAMPFKALFDMHCSLRDNTVFHPYVKLMKEEFRGRILVYSSLNTPKGSLKVDGFCRIVKANANGHLSGRTKRKSGCATDLIDVSLNGCHVMLFNSHLTFLDAKYHTIVGDYPLYHVWCDFCYSRNGNNVICFGRYFQATVRSTSSALAFILYTYLHLAIHRQLYGILAAPWFYPISVRHVLSEVTFDLRKLRRLYPNDRIRDAAFSGPNGEQLHTTFWHRQHQLMVDGGWLLIDRSYFHRCTCLCRASAVVSPDEPARNRINEAPSSSAPASKNTGPGVCIECLNRIVSVGNMAVIRDGKSHYRGAWLSARPQSDDAVVRWDDTSSYYCGGVSNDVFDGNGKLVIVWHRNSGSADSGRASDDVLGDVVGDDHAWSDHHFRLEIRSDFNEGKANGVRSRVLLPGSAAYFGSLVNNRYDGFGVYMADVPTPVHNYSSFFRNWQSKEDDSTNPVTPPTDVTHAKCRFVGAFVNGMRHGVGVERVRSTENRDNGFDCDYLMISHWNRSQMGWRRRAVVLLPWCYRIDMSQDGISEVSFNDCSYYRGGLRARDLAAPAALWYNGKQHSSLFQKVMRFERARAQSNKDMLLRMSRMSMCVEAMRTPGQSFSMLGADEEMGQDQMDHVVVQTISGRFSNASESFVEFSVDAAEVKFGDETGMHTQLLLSDRCYDAWGRLKIERNLFTQAFLQFYMQCFGLSTVAEDCANLYSNLCDSDKWGDSIDIGIDFLSKLNLSRLSVRFCRYLPADVAQQVAEFRKSTHTLIVGGDPDAKKDVFRLKPTVREIISSFSTTNAKMLQHGPFHVLMDNCRILWELLYDDGELWWSKAREDGPGPYTRRQRRKNIVNLGGSNSLSRVPLRHQGCYDLCFLSHELTRMLMLCLCDTIDAVSLTTRQCYVEFYLLIRSCVDDVFLKDNCDEVLALYADFYQLHFWSEQSSYDCLRAKLRWYASANVSDDDLLRYQFMASGDVLRVLGDARASPMRWPFLSAAAQTPERRRTGGMFAHVIAILKDLLAETTVMAKFDQLKRFNITLTSMLSSGVAIGDHSLPLLTVCVIRLGDAKLAPTVAMMSEYRDLDAELSGRAIDALLDQKGMLTESCQDAGRGEGGDAGGLCAWSTELLLRHLYAVCRYVEQAEVPKVVRS